jgi:signal transduction histidine kinase
MFTQIEFTGASIFFGGAMIGVIDIAFILLFAIVFLMVFRERFFEYGIRNSIWLVPFIIIQTWIWYWFITESFDISIIWGYFTRIESYITILTLLGTNILAAILGAIARERYNVFISRIKKIEV